MTLAAGDRVGPYEIAGLLAAGGMGEGYRARDRRLGREVAIKRLPASAKTDPERLQRFELEARATSALNHPNVLALYDVGFHEGTPYVVSELLEGQTLRERLADGALPVRKALDYARQIARGLAAAHDRDIVHRDLKPENVVVTRDGHVKILDFGLARLLSEEGEAPADADTAGRVLGTVGYMSPEQVRGEAADGRSDLFAFGAVLYEMLTGQRAFKRAAAVETMNAVLKEDPAPFPSGLAIPPGLERVVWHCLEKAPQDRFQSSRDLAFDLESLTSVSVPPIAGLPARTRRRDTGIALLALGAGAALATLALALWPKPLPEPPLFERLTFRRGTIESARFAPDGHTVVFGAAWGGEPVEVFAGRLGSPESRRLGFAGTELLAVSASGDLALSLRRRRIGTFVGTGLLARAPLAGGSPRDVQEDVQAADFAPDGSLAIVRSVAGRNRLEFPIGTVLYETAGWVSHPRFSPTGELIAFLDHTVWGDDGGHVTVVDLKGRARTLSRNWGTLQGLAWPPDGREIWFTGTRAGAARAIVALGLEGGERVVARMTGVLTLHDVSGDGRVLLSHHDQRREIVARAPGESGERDLSWLDYCYPSDLSDDGSTVFFAENGEGGGPGYSVYTRRTDGAPAVRLGEGAAMSLSPDQRHVLASRNFTSDAPELVLFPTGAGQPQPLPRGGVNTQAASFFPDGRRVLLAANAPGRPTRTWVQDLDGGDPRPLTPDGTRFTLATRPVSPDGRHAVLQDAEGRHVLVATEGGKAGPLAGLEPAEQPLRWAGDGRALYAYRPGEIPARVFRLEVASGRREPWLTLVPSDRSGVLAVNPVLLTPDGRTYVYGYRRVLSDLYAASGLR